MARLAMLVAHLLAGWQLSGFEFRHLPNKKYKMGFISKGVANTFEPEKKLLRRLRIVSKVT